MNNLFTDIVTESWSWPWWGVMVAINIISCLVFIYLLIKMIKDNKKDKTNRNYRILLMVFGALYMGVAMYRSVFVSSYTGRLAWFDSMANSMFVIRCLATFAEISFACLIGLGLKHMNEELALPDKIKNNKGLSTYLNISPWIIISCLSIAQFFAWSGLLSQYKVLFAIEETLWALGFTSILPLVLIQLINLSKNYKGNKSTRMYYAFTLILAIFTIGYLLFQYVYQLPFEYYGQLADDFANGIHYGLNIESLHRIIYDYHPTRSFQTWGGIGFFIWHSGYFSICVWMTIYFANGPRLLNKENIVRND